MTVVNGLSFQADVVDTSDKQAMVNAIALGDKDAATFVFRILSEIGNHSAMRQGLLASPIKGKELGDIAREHYNPYNTGLAWEAWGRAEAAAKASPVTP